MNKLTDMQEICKNSEKVYKHFRNVSKKNQKDISSGTGDIYPWFSLNLNDCIQGCLMQNFRIIASILTEFFNSLPDTDREGHRQTGREGVSERTKM